MDFTQFFKQYEVLVASAEKAFNRVRELHPEAVRCATRCSDCCHALFDLSLVEALYINQKFSETFSGAKKHAILERANRADRKIYRIKKDAVKARDEGVSEVEILGRMSMERVPCPLLGEDDTCELYAFRPITCRLYGIPTSSNGVSHTCGMSGFEQGKPYPTVNMDALHEKLYQVSKDMVDAMKTRYTRMAEMLVPLSMALLTDYDDTYLGITPEKPEGKEENA
ncbi:YkgJ family cysteine cluster protein [Desulfobotulus sp.]|jgi:Fe-S-cluster containining protein|uniref:YkgJ family cysteine cluster protein n=1 Tax=Desulfobotulus sp. TaxID=1940337 RepID=UPI002A366BEE|nr:YkgJ family cysteine cluster protein [Desulfobotulus sp.]MDY0163823.1 YkgJ family cysteine cluster protein [Desulfobotulus sp.]